MLTENAPVQLSFEFNYAEAGISETLAATLEAHAVKQENINAAARDNAVDAVMDTAANFSAARDAYLDEHESDETWNDWVQRRFGCSVSTANRALRIATYFDGWEREQLRLIPASRLLKIVEAKLKGPKLTKLKRLLKKDDYLTAKEVDELIGASTKNEKSITTDRLTTEEELHDKLLKRIKAVRDQAEEDLQVLVPDQLRVIAGELNGSS